MDNTFMENRIAMLENELHNILEAEKIAKQEADAKKNFLMNVSYELKTALAGILETAEEILKESDDNRINKYARDIKNIGNTLFSITNGIFELSQNKMEQMKIIPVKYEFNKTVNDIMNMTSKRVRSKGLAYSVRTDSNIPRKLYGDETRIKQIMLILIINAVKHTEYGEIKVDFSFERKNHSLYIEVGDAGTGIEPEKFENISKGNLFSEDNKLGENDCVKGFGLYLVKRFVKLMDGEIQCESKHGEGTVFTVRIPQVIIDDEPIVNSIETYTVDPFESGRYKPSIKTPDSKILIVDDDDINLDIASAMLKETQIKISTASSGAECIQKLEREKFDIVLLDCMMPEMSGKETLDKIRTDKIADETPIIAFTADNGNDPSEYFLAEGFDGYLLKPMALKKMERLLIDFLPRNHIDVH